MCKFISQESGHRSGFKYTKRGAGLSALGIELLKRLDNLMDLVNVEQQVSATTRLVIDLIDNNELPMNCSGARYEGIEGHVFVGIHLQS